MMNQIEFPGDIEGPYERTRTRPPDTSGMSNWTDHRLLEELSWPSTPAFRVRLLAELKRRRLLP